MVDVSVALPEPRPEDDEDVVWGLSTATALWMRGERRDAIVWLRRAAEAAISAGQDFRGSELGICASDLEHLLDDAASRPYSYPPPAVAAARPQTNPPPVFPAAARPQTSPPSPVFPAADGGGVRSPFTEPTLPSAPGLRALSPASSSSSPPAVAAVEAPVDMEAPILPPPVRLIPPAPRAPTFSPQAFTPLPAAAAPAAPGPSSYRPPPPVPAAPVQTGPGSSPPATGPTTSYRPPPPPAPKPASPTTLVSPALPPPTGVGNIAPSVRSSTITPPPPPVMPSQRPAPSSGEKATPLAPPVIGGAPPAPASATSPSDPARSVVPSSRTTSTTIRKSQPRAPILDPWAEEPTQPSGRAHESIRVAQATGGDEVILARRKRTNTRNSEDEEEVVTSAVSLDEMLGRKAPQPPPPPPPTRKPTIPDGLPGQLAQAIPAVPSKVPPPVPSSTPRAAPPPVPAAAAPELPSSRETGSSQPPAAAAAPPAVVAAPPIPAAAPPAAVAAPPIPAAAPPAAVAAPPIPAAAPPVPASAAPSVVAVPPSAVATPPATRPVSDVPPAPPRKSPSNAPPPAPSARVVPPIPAAPRPAAPAPSAARPAAAPVLPPRPTPSKAPPPPPVVPAEPPSLGSVPLEDVDPFGDLPPDVQKHLVDIAFTRVLGADEAVSGFGTALLIEGEAVITAVGAEAAASRAVRGTLIPARGSINDAPEIRLVAGPDGATVASWDQAQLEDALKSCPWVMEEITERAERLQSLAGATLGPLGEVDEMSRNQLLDQLAVRVAHPGQAVAAQGEALNGVALVCAGTIELLDDTDAPWKSLRPGDLLFARAVLEGRAAPCRARAGAGGALLLVGEQGLAQALVRESPELATFLSSTNE